MLVGTDVCVWMVLVGEETGVLVGNPPIRLGVCRPYLNKELFMQI